MKARANRRFLKGMFPGAEEHPPSDQEKGLPQPPLVKPVAADARLIDLPDPRLIEPARPLLRDCIQARVSHRKFAPDAVSLAQLSFLLWATQGVTSVAKNGYFTKRTVPSGGARHPFETYLAVNRVDGLEPGIYRYEALGHKLLFSRAAPDLKPALVEATCGQKFCGEGAVLFAWSVVPYRSEWRYDDHAAKAILLDAGHVAQNLYLACEALALGTCAIAAYDQDKADSLFGVDGEDEFILYLAPVGRPVLSDSANRSS